MCELVSNTYYFMRVVRKKAEKNFLNSKFIDELVETKREIKEKEY